MSQLTDHITVQCTCGKRLKAPASAAGKKAKCPKCGSVVRIDAPPPPPEEEGVLGLDALYDLAEKEAQVAAQQEATAPATVRCPSCGSALQADAVLCVNCGYDLRTRSKVAPKREQPAPGMPVPKYLDAGKKSGPKDKIAPQRSIFIGIAGSAAGALIGGLVWFGVAMATGYEFYFLALIVGAAAGAGMQIGQQGYSTIGGFIAGGMTFVGVLLAKLAIVAAVLMPMVNRSSRAGKIVEGDPAVSHAIVEELEQQTYKEMKIDPEDATEEQMEKVEKRALAKAERLTPAERNALIKRVKEREAREELEELYTYEYAQSKNIDLDEANEKVSGQVEAEVKQKLDAMTPAQRDAELKRLRAKADAEEKEAMKKFEEEAEAEKSKPGAAAAAPDNDDADDAGLSTGAKVGLGVLLIGVLFGIKGLFFTIGGMLLAYRTAAGAVWG